MKSPTTETVRQQNIEIRRLHRQLTLAIKAIEDAPHSISCPVIAEHYTSQYGINTYKQRDKPAADYLCNCWKADVLGRLGAGND